MKPTAKFDSSRFPCDHRSGRTAPTNWRRFLSSLSVFNNRKDWLLVVVRFLATKQSQSEEERHRQQHAPLFAFVFVYRNETKEKTQANQNCRLWLMLTCASAEGNLNCTASNN